MKRLALLLIIVLLLSFESHGQPTREVFSLRATWLAFPSQVVLTAEVSVFNKVGVQVETNFRNTHGINLKYYLVEDFSMTYVFLGSGLLQDERLREGDKSALLTYAGFGYSQRWRRWIADSRIGLGPIWRFEQDPLVVPVLKVGFGCVF